MTREKVLRIVTIAMFILAAISAYTTFLGANEMVDPSRPWYYGVVPYLFAAGAFIFCSIFYWIYFYVFPRTHGWKKAALFALIPVFATLFFGMSTFFSVVGFGGDSAVSHHINSTIEGAEKLLAKIVASLNREQELTTALGQLSTQFDALAKAEAVGGMTNLVGQGPTTATLATVGKVLAEMKTIVAGQRPQIDAARVKAVKSLTALRKINGSTGSIGEKIPRIAAELSNLNDMLGQLAALSVARPIRSAASGLDRLVLQQPDESTAKGRAQALALKKIGSILDQTKQIVTQLADDLVGERPEVQTLTVMDVGTAVFTYWREIKAAWAAAIGFDFAALLFLFIVELGIHSLPTELEYLRQQGRVREEEAWQRRDGRARPTVVQAEIVDDDYPRGDRGTGGFQDRDVGR